MVASTTADAQAPPAHGRALDDPAVQRSTITFGDKPGDMVSGFLAEPHGTHKRGGVIVIHEIFGLTDHIKDVTCRLARAGYTALAPDLFTREGTPPDMAKGFAPLMAFVGKISDRQILGDLKSAVAYLRHYPHSNGKVGSVGFCWGGRFSMLLAADSPELNAAVAYYGRISGKPTENQFEYPLDIAGRMHAPLLGNFGALDTGIPPSEVDKLRQAMKEHHKTSELYEYAGAGHAFNNDTRESYNAEAAQLAWKRTLAWYAKYLKS
jgi:carboxymethylenebutenolidase